MLLALPLVMCACGEIELPEVQQEEETPVTEEYSKKFTFTIKGDFANPQFCDVEDGDISVPVSYDRITEGYGDSQRMSRANQYMTADGVEMTDMWVVDYKDGSIQQSIHQSNTDADWGAPTMSLTLGTHHVLFLASRGTEPAYNDGVVTWAKPHDTFYCDYEVTVAKTSNGNRAVTLDRVATKLMLTINDIVPVGTTTITMQPSKWYNGWNMLTGTPIAATDYTQTLSIPASWGGLTNRSAVSWSLSSADEWLTDLHYTSYAGTAVNGEILIKDAPLKANRTTKYAGNFYSNAEASSVTLNAEWLADYEGVY